MNVTVVGGMGKLGSEIAEHIKQFYPVRIADIKPGGEPTAEATKDADIVIVLVDTPSLPGGAYDVSKVCAACSEIDLTRWRMICISCTVNPGDTEGAIRDAMYKNGKVAHLDFGLAYAPEFVRQGSVQLDFADPEFVIAGCATTLERDVLEEFYETVCHMAPTFMSIESAEIAKIGLNTAITAKLAKANEIAWLCHYTPGADARDVLNAIGQDPRIGSRYFKAGPPPGGPCFPRDNLAFVAAWNEAIGRRCPTEETHSFWMRQVGEMGILALSEGNKPGVAGLSFKPGHSDPTESPGNALAMALGAETYDPIIPSTCASIDELFELCDVIVLAMPFDGMQRLLEAEQKNITVVDWWGALGDSVIRFGKGLEKC